LAEARIYPEDSATYMGVFDDQVELNPWPGTKKYFSSDQYIQYTLMRHVILGGPLLLNDGYLIQSSFCRKALQSNGDNGLRYLIDIGYVSLLTTPDGPVASLEKRAKTVPSIEQVISSSAWKELRGTLIEIERNLERRNLLVPFPNLNFSASILRGFNTVGSKKNVAEIGLEPGLQDPFNRAIEIFSQRAETEEMGPRSLWQSTLDDMQKSHGLSAIAKSRLMNLANEIYHYRMSSCIAAESDKTIAVETAVSPAFDEILETAEMSHTDISAMPNFNLPLALSFANVRKIHELLHPGHKIYNAKTEYLNDLYLYGVGKIPRDQFESSAKHYARLVSEHFGKSITLGATLDAGLSILVLGAKESLKYSGIPAELVNKIGTSPEAIDQIKDFIETNGLNSNMMDFINGGIGIISDSLLLPMITKKIIAKNFQWSMYRSIESGDWLKKIKRNNGVTKFASVVIDRNKAISINQGLPSFKV